jgi:hypothetical protein
MKKATATLIGMSDLMFGTHVTTPKRDDETHDQYEERTWQHKVRLLDDVPFLQPFALKNALESASKWLAMKIPGEGKKTFTKRFASGVLVTEKMPLVDSKGKPLSIDDVEPVRIFAPSDGVRGSGKRVFRIFPTVHEWQTTCEIVVFDNKISNTVLEKHLVAAGKFIGFGSMRVENGGINGRFHVEDLKVEDIADDLAA